MIAVLVREIRKKNRSDRALRLLSKRVIEAGEEERRHIARELHDDVGQRLSLLSFQLDIVNGQLHSDARSPERPNLDEPLQELSTLITDVHKLSHRLHSTKLEHLGLKVALTELCEHFSQKHGLRIDLRAGTIPPDLRHDVALCFYRVAQEAMNNVVKHSRAVSVQIVFSASQERLEMKLADSGKGFDKATAPIGLGLTAMEERVRTLNGVFSLHSKPGNGTRIFVSIPTLAPMDADFPSGR